MQNNTDIPVLIKTPTGANQTARTFVVNVSDSLKPGFYEQIRAAEKEYGEQVEKWQRLVIRLKKERSSALLRWELGAKIKGFFDALRAKSSFVVTNKLEALAHDLGVSESALGYILRMPERFTKVEVEKSKLKWSKFQEILDIRDDAKMRDCVKLILAGRILLDDDIRAFKRKANRRDPP